MSVIIIISGLHYYVGVAPLAANSLQSGRFWARSSALVHDSLWESRLLCTVFIQVICGHPGGLFQYTVSVPPKYLMQYAQASKAQNFPSVHWLDNRKGILPVKNLGVGLLEVVI